MSYEEDTCIRTNNTQAESKLRRRIRACHMRRRIHASGPKTHRQNQRHLLRTTAQCHPHNHQRHLLRTTDTLHRRHSRLTTDLSESKVSLSRSLTHTHSLSLSRSLSLSLSLSLRTNDLSLSLSLSLSEPTTFLRTTINSEATTLRIL